MAALSRKHLGAAGYQVELLVYPDTYGATAWLWREALADFKMYSQLAPSNPDGRKAAARVQKKLKAR